MEWAPGDTVAEKPGRKQDMPCAAGKGLLACTCAQLAAGARWWAQRLARGVRNVQHASLQFPPALPQTPRAFPLPPSLQGFLLLSQVTCVPGKNGKWISPLTNIPFQDLSMNVIYCSQPGIPAQSLMEVIPFIITSNS